MGSYLYKSEMINKPIRRIDILVVLRGNIFGSRSVGTICFLHINELNEIAIFKHITPTE